MRKIQMAGEDSWLLASVGEPIWPPQLEDAGLEDCTLPLECIAKAFSLATMDVSSLVSHLPLSDDYEDEGDDPLKPRGCGVGGYVDDAGPTRGVIPEAILSARVGSDGGADEVMVIGNGRGKDGDEVVVGGHKDEEDRVVVVGEEQEGSLDGRRAALRGSEKESVNRDV